MLNPADNPSNLNLQGNPNGSEIIRGRYLFVFHTFNPMPTTWAEIFRTFGNALPVDACLECDNL